MGAKKLNIPIAKRNFNGPPLKYRQPLEYRIAFRVTEDQKRKVEKHGPNKVRDLIDSLPE